MSQEARYPIDLHTHTTASDGTLTPTKLVALAHQQGLKVLGITDHDTMEGLEEADIAAQGSDLHIIRGIEVNTDWMGKEVHVLGYGLDPQNSTLSTKLRSIQRMRENRIHQILEKLLGLDVPVTFEEVVSYAMGKSIGRPHVAQAMVARGYVRSVKEAFDLYLRMGGLAYVPRYKMEPKEAIQMICLAGGVPVLAHPGNRGLETMLPVWVQYGLRGIEINHPDHTADDTYHYRKLANELGLLTTGGSDYHGPKIKPGIELGLWGMEWADYATLNQTING